MSSQKESLHFTWSQLHRSDIAGDVLRFALFVESSVDDVLIDYFVPGDRRGPFEDLLLQQLSFYQKLEIFSKLPLQRPLRSHQNLCALFASTRRLRNYVAHSYRYDEPAIRKLANDPYVLRFLRDYPASRGQQYRLVHRQLAALRKAKKNWTSTLKDDTREVPF